MEEPLTTRPASLGNVAHIVAEKQNGTRGKDPLPMSERGELSNVILLCAMHHAFIDKKEQEDDYPAALLREFKRVHEMQIKNATSTLLTEKTHAIRLVGQIRGHIVGVSDVEIRAAVFTHERRHVEDIIDIDLGTILDGADSSYLKTGKHKINAELTRRILPQLEDHTIKRLSIFALSRIPLIAVWACDVAARAAREVARLLPDSEFKESLCASSLLGSRNLDRLQPPGTQEVEA